MSSKRHRTTNFSTSSAALKKRWCWSRACSLTCSGWSGVHLGCIPNLPLKLLTISVLSSSFFWALVRHLRTSAMSLQVNPWLIIRKSNLLYSFRASRQDVLHSSSATLYYMTTCLLHFIQFSEGLDILKLHNVIVFLDCSIHQISPFFL